MSLSILRFFLSTFLYRFYFWLVCKMEKKKWKWQFCVSKLCLSVGYDHCHFLFLACTLKKKKHSSFRMVLCSDNFFYLGFVYFIYVYILYYIYTYIIFCHVFGGCLLVKKEEKKDLIMVKIWNDFMLYAKPPVSCGSKKFVDLLSNIPRCISFLILRSFNNSKNIVYLFCIYSDFCILAHFSFVYYRTVEQRTD